MGKDSKRNYKRGKQQGYTDGALGLFQKYIEFARDLGADQFLLANGWENPQPNWWISPKTLERAPNETDYTKLALPTALAVVFETLVTPKEVQNEEEDTHQSA